MSPSPATQRGSSDFRFSFVGAWGVVGIAMLLGFSLYRVTPIALEPLMDGPVAWWVIALYAASVAFNAWMEGYRGFHQRVAPKVARRAHELNDNPSLFDVVFAPLYCAGYYAAPRPALIARYILTLSIVGVIVAMKFVPQPWRGIVDAGVVVGLSIGAASIVYTWTRSIREPKWLTQQLRAAGLLEEGPDEQSSASGDLVPDVPAHGAG